ncbi:hypothetical protein C2E23DRAFT_868473 [Lenzites betulinus]|nr:hypothetical protein C2E23DRAFT_868473 [Lenzites betulinus]
MTTPLQPYKGSIRKLVIAMDVGTTYSGVAFAVLDPGEVPRIHGVTRFPGQENDTGKPKIPSILYYRQNGTVHCAGAEAALPDMEMVAEDEDLILVEWFKLHLRPKTLASEISQCDLPALPEGKTILDVFADFLRYLFDCTRQYINDTHANGKTIWHSVTDRIEFVLSHPNGWEGLQQSKMRRAAVLAGLVPDTAEGRNRVRFVSEGEASLHYCARNGLTADSISDGDTVMIVDAGGGTVDISSYSFVSTLPLSVEEVAPADCILQGSTRVNARAKEFLQEKLNGSEYGSEDDINTMLDYFEKHTKPYFRDSSEASYIKFGSIKCNDAKAGIRRGQLLLSGAEMEGFYKPSLDAIVATIQKQRQVATRPISTVFLVGGFAASPWLHASLLQACEPLGLRVCRPSCNTSKAVAEGGVSFYLENCVSARVIRVTYGINVAVPYDPTDLEHIARRSGMFEDLSGRRLVSGAFSAYLVKGTRITEDEERSQDWQQLSTNMDKLSTITSHLLCYKGTHQNVHWIDTDPSCFEHLCSVHADTSNVVKIPQVGPRGIYYKQSYKIVLMCGLTELKAQIRWDENLLKHACHSGPATIVYDDNA